MDARYHAHPSPMPKDPHPKPPIEDLIRRARTGDDAALKLLFEQSGVQMKRLAARRAIGKQSGISRPSDLAQETMLLAFRSFASFSGTTEKQWWAWLKSIFSNEVKQAIRDAGRMMRNKAVETTIDAPSDIDVAGSQVSPSQETATEEEYQKVFAQIFELPEDQKKAIWLCHLKEKRVAEVAKQMGKTEAAVAGLLQRGLKTLREQFADEPNRKTPETSSTTREQKEARSALLIFLRRRDAGEQVDSAAFLAGFPGCAEELRGLLAWVERLQAIRPTNPDGER